jgi:hypothetical protein
LRKIAQFAGVEINYPYSDASWQSCKEFICVTGGVGGVRELSLPNECIYDIFSNRIIKKVDGKFEVKFLPYEVKLFFVGKLSRIQQFKQTYLENISKVNNR